MAYVTKLWAADEIIQVEELNHIEQGVYDVHVLADALKKDLDKLVFDKLYLYNNANSNAISLAASAADISITDIDTTNSSVVSIQVSYTGLSSGVEIAIFCANDGLAYTSTAVGVMNLNTENGNDIIFLSTDFDKLQLKLINKDATNSAVVEVAIKVLTESGTMHMATYDDDNDGVVNEADVADVLKNETGNKTYSDIAAEIDADVLTHKNDPAAHHTRYTDAEALAVINADLNHGTNAHHNYRTDEEIRDVIASFVKQGENVLVFHDDAANTLTISSNSLSEADRAKFDSIETGATADQTGPEIVSLINASASVIDIDNVNVSSLTSQITALQTDVTALKNEDTYQSTYSGETIDELLRYVDYLRQYNSQPVGIKVDPNTSPASVQVIDINGNALVTTPTFFNNHVAFQLRKCVRNRITGEIKYGSDNKGTGLTLDGTAGDVLVEIPTVRYKFLKNADGSFCYWIIPYTDESPFPIHPATLQRGGVAKYKYYVGAYEASLFDDAGTLKLASVAGAQPWTGGQIRALTFTSGGVTAFAKGEQLTGATSGATGYVIDYHLTSGAWATGDAAGVVYLKLPGIEATTATAYQAESLTGSIAGVDCATASGAATALTLTMDQAEDYGNAIGTGFGICNVWTYADIQLRMYIEYGTRDIQAALARGVVDVNSTLPGFSGKNTSADGVDDNLSANGTGVGTGINGLTPFTWRNLQNLHGNCYELAIGANAFNANGTDSDGVAYTTNSYRIINHMGTVSKTLSATMPVGTYEVGTYLYPADTGYVSLIQPDEFGCLSFMPYATTATNSTYFCDLAWPPTNLFSILRVSGSWKDANGAGPEYHNFHSGITSSSNNAGCRIEFHP